MRYSCEYHPNPDCMGVHLDVRLTKKMIESYEEPVQPDYEEGERPAFVRDIFEIPGVTSVSLHTYNIQIMKGSVFEWREIVDRVINVLLTCFDPTGTAIKVKDDLVHPTPTPEQIRHMEEAFGDWDL